MTLHIERFDLRKMTGKRRNAKVYVFPTSETILQHLFARHERPIEQFREVTQERIKNELTKRGLLTNPDTFSMSWSNKCGCACGCSPGFTIHDTTKAVDIYVDVSEEV